ncbi:hypothetical protein [Streptacidiphilus sp. PAMC 29251]
MLKSHTCLTILCDVCKTDAEIGEGVPHWDSARDAAEWARSICWDVTEDGVRAVCDRDDEDHEAARADLLPPYPAVEVDGQLALPAAPVAVLPEDGQA